MDGVAAPCAMHALALHGLAEQSAAKGASRASGSNQVSVRGGIRGHERAADRDCGGMTCGG